MDLKRLKNVWKCRFTLIELLIVITILIILAALLLPVLGRARAMARAALCLSNVHQWGLAFHLYVDEYEQPFPCNHRVVQFGFLYPYIADLNAVALCPETQRVPGTGALMGTADRIWRYRSWEGGYGLNGFWYASHGIHNGGSGYIGGGSIWPDAWFDSYARVSHPENSPVFLDAVWVDGWPRNGALVPDNFYDPTHGKRSPSARTDHSMDRFFVNRHPQVAINVTFSDGHAAKVRLAELWNLEWSRVFVPEGIKAF
ncbi:MAG: hypothetical protein D6820_00345 [Lentisphaerae bacterium]|nr:MAG: hypothetical protein D6820_00345 [Lentisphaerota bacterium]